MQTVLLWLFLLSSLLRLGWSGSAADQAADRITRGPYLQLGTCSNIVVRWRTAGAVTGVVHYGTASNVLDRAVADASASKEHRRVIDRLEPAKRYFYAVDSKPPLAGAASAVHAFVTSPRPGTSVPTRVWVLGDSGTKDRRAQAVRDAYESFTSARGTDVWLMLGDNAYQTGTDKEYQKAVFEMYPETLASLPLWPTFGNHEGYSSSSPQGKGPYYDAFSLPRRGEAGGLPSGTEAYYSFDHGDIHFISLNSHDIDRSTNSAMMTWLKQDLAQNQRRWTIAFFHHPPYTAGSHDSESDKASGGRMKEAREALLPVLEGGGVDLVLSGHSHSYERSFLLDSQYGKSKDPAAVHLKDGGDGRPDGSGPYRKPTLDKGPHEGTVYVVAGSSGQTSGGKLNHPAMCVSWNVLGSLVLDVDGTTLDGRFVDDKANVRDHFQIVKGERPR